ncbi:LysR family transcriptional regulator [Undibacterium sp. Jales W-56]|uniref:LysR family transcriptional regulator n=1 Tax=Undibacterium sp. Jales W-56 TaxID=2897325 RepID=UPI0021D27B2B|nr:LysR family transcriptional regulator [Undibacterium sp. Jales W-56]MCU6434913.1 LysR family transcriptional regulator [Undibacterium sp. Jales W-56]
MDRLQSMRIFSKVVEQGSFARAAIAMEMSNAVVTRYMADLEAHLGTRLLNRTTRKLSLTETGQIYLERVRQILADIDDADAVASYSAKKPSGTLRIYSHPSFSRTQLAPLLPKFAKEFPDIVLDVRVTDRNVDLVEEGFDIGFFLDLQKIDASMIARKLATSEILLCASPDYIKQYGVPKNADDVSNHKCLNFGYDFLRDNWIVQGKRGEPPSPRQIPIHSCVISNNADVLRECALAGMGLVLRASVMLGDDLSSGRLVRLFPEFLLGDISISMVYPSRRLLSAKVRNFVNFVATQFPHPEIDKWLG